MKKSVGAGIGATHAMRAKFMVNTALGEWTA